MTAELIYIGKCFYIFYYIWIRQNSYVSHQMKNLINSIAFNVTYITLSRPARMPTKHLLQWVPWTVTLGPKWPAHEADHFLPSSSKVKNGSAIPAPPPNQFGIVLN
jgi:hypothetical protein